MKENIEKFIQLHTDFKQACYDYCNKWHEYQKSSGIQFSQNEYFLTNFKDIPISELEFEYYDDGTKQFIIGTYYGDIERTYIPISELFDESIIKNKIDARINEFNKKESEKKAEAIKKSLDREMKDYEEYLRLKKKYQK